MNSLLTGIKKSQNVAYTANGAASNASTLNEVLDFFGLGAALRTRTETDVVSLFSKAFATDQLLALKTIFYIRDVRGGQGERKTFRTVLNWLGKNHPSIVEKNLDNVTKYGRWDDLYVLEGTPAWEAALEFIFNQFNEDCNNLAALLTGKKKDVKLSLLPKWLSSPNASSVETCRRGRFFAQKFNLTEREYRKILSKMRAQIDIVERKMSGREWTNINYQGVPSRASLIYKDAFKKHDSVGYAKFISKVEKGEAKINAATLYPYDIVRDVMTSTSHNATNQVLWDSLPNYIPENGEYSRILCLCDVSGSMEGLPMQVSISLGLYCSERMSGPFKDHFLTFNTESKLEKVIGSNITERVHNLKSADWGGSTNLQSAFDAILVNAIRWGVKEEEMPEVLIIISDFEFDAACNSGATNFDVIKSKYAAAGYKMAKIVFWNVNSTNNQSPILFNDKGVCLVSGCSPSILKSVLSGKIVSPIDTMLEVLSNNRYDTVKV